MRAGTHTVGPADARLQILTRRAGIAARAGHDLTLEVTNWEAVLVLGDAPSLTLTADPRSLAVRAGSGGVKPLTDRDRREIVRNVERDVLGAEPIAFRSIGAWADGDRLQVEGELTLNRTTRPAAFELRLAGDGSLEGRARIVQSAFGIRPFSGLMGTLRIA